MPRFWRLPGRFEHHGGFRHGGFRRRHGPWHPHRFEPLAPDADGDDGPPPPPQFPFPPLPPIFPGLGEMEAERYGRPHHRRHGFRDDDQEAGLNDEPPEPPGEETGGRRRSGRWIRTRGKLILIGV
jgi:hypothetical protein